MKKKISIILMAISLCITVYATMFWQPSNENIYNAKEESTTVFNNNVDGNNNVIDNGIEKNNSSDENIIGGVENLESKISNSDTENNKENIHVDTSYEISIFKTEELKLEKNIEKSKKQRIDQIIKKMSSSDIIKVKDMFNNENKEVGFREGFSLIKLRVSLKDYEEIKLMLSEYIDFNVLDN